MIRRTELEQRVLEALKARFLTPERLEEFTRVYVAETNRLRAEDFEQKIRGLASALEHEDLEQRELARSALGGASSNGSSSSRPATRSFRWSGTWERCWPQPATGRSWLRSVMVVAGAGFEPATFGL